MSFFISETLANQVASKSAAIEILQAKGKIPNNLQPFEWAFIFKLVKIRHVSFGVQAWSGTCQRIAKNPNNRYLHKGFSTIISWKDIALRLFDKAKKKAIDLLTNRISETQIKVQSSGNPDGWWTVASTDHGLTCDCHLYKGVSSRLLENGEAPPLLKALHSNPAQVAQNRLQICCHHVLAAMWNEFDAESLSDYLANYQEITTAWTKRNRNWGQLSFKVAKPTARPSAKPELNPEIPEGTYLERTDDWMSLEYRVWCYAQKGRLASSLDIPWTTKNIGRLVEVTDGFNAYRPSSGVGISFKSKYEAVAYLIKNAGYTLDQVTNAFQLKQQPA
jgi:hypothetical protein